MKWVLLVVSVALSLAGGGWRRAAGGPPRGVRPGLTRRLVLAQDSLVVCRSAGQSASGRSVR